MSDYPGTHPIVFGRERIVGLYNVQMVDRGPLGWHVSVYQHQPGAKPPRVYRSVNMTESECKAHFDEICYAALLDALPPMPHPNNWQRPPEAYPEA